MLKFGPESPDMVAYYREKLTEYTEIADALSIARLHSDAFRELSDMLGSEDSARLVEGVARLRNYSDKADHALMRKAVSKLLKKSGTTLKRGKRTKPEMEWLVSDMVPLLLYHGIKPASSERSHLVRTLRLIAETFGVDGDPRDELRRVSASHRELDRKQKQATAQIWLAALSALRPD